MPEVTEKEFLTAPYGGVQRRDGLVVWNHGVIAEHADSDGIVVAGLKLPCWASSIPHVIGNTEEDSVERLVDDWFVSRGMNPICRDYVVAVNKNDAVVMDYVAEDNRMTYLIWVYCIRKGRRLCRPTSVMMHRAKAMVQRARQNLHFPCEGMVIGVLNNRIRCHMVPDA